MGVLLVGALPGPGWAADDVLHEIIWAHSSPGVVERFIVFVSPVSGATQSARRVEVGKPVSRTIGTVQTYSAILAIDPDDYLAIAAVGFNGALSGLTTWRSAPPTRPGQPVVIEP